MLKKIASRKFIVWISWMITIITAIFTGKITDSLVNGAIIVSIVYIGGNIAQDYIFNKGK